MDNFLTELGIKHEVTNSYTPEMNGVAERFNLTALDGIKTLLKSSEVPHKFWGEALLCFTYAWNRICHKDSNKTPFEKYSGRKPSVLHLKPFGCLAYAGVPKQIRKKFDMRAKMGIMMGYAQRTKGYRIWLIDENKLVETINFTCRNCGGGDRGRVAICRPFGEVSLSLNRTVTCMVLKANDRRTSCPCHDESRGPRSDYVRQVALATTTTTNFVSLFKADKNSCQY
ncbi:retrovirus-related Pol polyprotein from transposon TNT 1-94 [Trichonephila clavipes]|nr:retrovirus-related Pol polyprotein from transposon TNT 1-94 [Trichonephila clavipes]